MLKLPTGPITLSREEFKAVLFGVRGAKPVTITARTIPRLNGGAKNRLAGLQKLSMVNGIINFSYENAVNRQRDREGVAETFRALPRRSGIRLFTDEEKMIPLVAKVDTDFPYFSFEDLKRVPVDKLYLELKVQKTLKHEYYLNGEVVPNDQAEEEVYVSPSSSRQGVENEVILRDYALDNVEEVVMDGDVFILARELTLPQFFQSHQKKGEHVAV